MKLNIAFCGVLMLLLLQACDMFEYHPYDGKTSGEKGINAKNSALIEEKCAGKTTIRFAFISDTQRWYDDTEDFVKHMNKREDIDFVIHGGDLVDFGMTNEFLWMRDILGKLKIPYVALLGNHDCLANGIATYNKLYGDENFSFIAGNVKFVCLNTNALEFDYSKPVPDFKFIEDEYNDELDYTKTIFAMHVRPNMEQFNNNVASVFQYVITQFPQLQFCIHGHGHNFEAIDIFEDGVIYYETPCIHKKRYLVFTIHDDDTYDYEVCSF